MNRLSEFAAQIETAEQMSQKEISKVRAEAVAYFETLMSQEPAKSQIEKMVAQVEASKELTGSAHSEFFSQWVRTDFSDLIDTDDAFQKEMLAQFLSEHHFVTVDFENDALLYDIGPCIIVNHEGDVLDQDSGKWFISRKDYETKAERNSQIEAYMNKTGYFPSVLYCDYHGNASYINTQPKTESQNETA